MTEQETQTLLLARSAKQRLLKADSLALREQIVDTASATGHHHIWIDVFQNDSDMVLRFKQKVNIKQSK
jgi:hypothetical protein